MGAKSSIEWCQATWNPIGGCTRVSPGCDNCYAMRVAARFSGLGLPYEGLAEMRPDGPRWTGALRVIEKHLLDPVRWKKPRIIFVNSMSDLFHKRLPDEAIDRVFAVMMACPQHTFVILTKRADRLHKYTTKAEGRVRDAAETLAFDQGWCHANEDDAPWPLPNVWAGVSVENQDCADKRLGHLAAAAVAVRVVSAEPLLGPVDLRLGRWIRLPAAVAGDGPWAGIIAPPGVYLAESNRHGALSVRATTGESLGVKPAEFERLPNPGWVIAGGESGQGARPMHADWARSLRDQCVSAGIPFFHKQNGVFIEYGSRADARPMMRVKKKIAGRLLDGRTWDEYPERVTP